MNKVALYDSIGRHEGARTNPYLDSKKLWTIGKGTCLETNPFTGAQWKYLLDHNLIKLALTPDGMDYLVSAKVDECIRYCSAWITNWDELSDVRQNVMIEFCYQLGVNALNHFPRMLAALEADNWTETARQMRDSEWYKQTPNRAEELAKAMEAG